MSLLYYRDIVMLTEINALKNGSVRWKTIEEFESMIVIVQPVLSSMAAFAQDFFFEVLVCIKYVCPGENILAEN